MSRMVMVMLVLTCGCASQQPTGPDVVFVVPGVGGDGGYAGLYDALKSEGRVVQRVTWGAPPPLFFVNFSTKSVHDAAEQKLADQLDDWRQMHPTGRIDLVGHSSGCGVILGALPRCTNVRVKQVVLLAPSVSPGYDLNPAISRIDGLIHVFHSNRDTMFLSWRTGNFGTYDRVKTKAAGNVGFSGEYASSKVVQHAYDPKWRQLGNDGGHFGTLSRRFAEQILEPLISN